MTIEISTPSPYLNGNGILGATEAPQAEPSSSIPEALRNRKQWVVWKWDERGGKTTKVPHNLRTGKPIDATNPEGWVSFNRAQGACDTGRYSGVGFVVSPEDPFCGLDIDHCISVETGEIAPEALDLVKRLDSYTEITPSNTGLRVWFEGTLPPEGRRRKWNGLGVEFYDQLRFFTVTGNRLAESLPTVEARQAELTAIHAEIFPPKASALPTKPQTVAAPLLVDDAALLARMFAAKNGAEIRKLWEGDIGAHSGGGGEPNHSGADFALCCHLLFWTGGDIDRTERLWGESGLRREKWGREDYRARTLEAALKATPNFYGSRPEPEPEPEEEGSEESTETTGRKRSAKNTLKDICLRETHLFKTPEGIPFVTLKSKGHLETWPLDGSRISGWLARRYHEDTGATAGGQDIKDALRTAAGFAEEGDTHPVFTRKACVGGEIFLDIGDPEWRAIRISSTGWGVVETPPVKFRRPNGLYPLPYPVSGGSIDALRPFLNVATEEDFRLIVAWLLAAIGPDTPYPVLALYGEQGSVKSTTARVLRRLIDPNKADLRRPPRAPEDLSIAANNGLVIALDNITTIPGWLSDTLCCVSTGGGDATRRLYSNDEEVIFDVKRPVVLTSIGDSVTKSDLLDRTIALFLPKIEETNRKTEEEFWEAFEVARPVILGALLDAVSQGLMLLPHTRLASYPRMADFARWATACECGLGWKAGSFLAAYKGNRDNSNTTALDANPVGEWVLRYADQLREDGKDQWEGTVGDLLSTLSDLVKNCPKSMGLPETWPKSARALSQDLRILAPNLRTEGVRVEFPPRKKEGAQVRIHSAVAGLV